MKQYLVLLFYTLLTFLFTNLKAQSPNWQWVRGGGGDAGNVNIGESAKLMGIDKNSNIYIGFNQAEEDFKIDTFFRYNPTLASFVCSYNCDGTLRWVKEIGKDAYGTIGGFAVDSNGNVYIAGESSGYPSPLAPVTMVDTTFNYPLGPQDFEYVLKLDSNGNRIWLQFPGNTIAWSPTSITSYMFNKSLVLNEQGEIEILYEPDTFVDTTILWSGTLIAQKTLHVAKFNSFNGNFISMKKLDFKYNMGIISEQLHFAVYNHEYYISYASFDDSLKIGGNLLVSTTFPPTPKSNFIIARFDSNGTYKWHQVTGGYTYNLNTNKYEFSNIVFKNGKMFTTGSAHSGVMVYGNQLINSLDTSQYCLYIVCKDTSDLDHAIWVSQQSRESNLITADDYLTLSGNEVITGPINTRILLNNGDTLGVNSLANNRGLCVISTLTSTGQALWGISNNHGYNSTLLQINALLADEKGNVFVGGYYNDSLYDNSNQGIFYNGGSKSDFFVSKISYSNQCECNAGPTFPTLLTQTGKIIVVKGSMYGTADSLVWIWGDGSSTNYINQFTNVQHIYSSLGTYSVCLRNYNTCGIKDSCFQLNIVDGIQEIQSEHNLLLYPNPICDILNITSDNGNPVEIEIHNILGQIIENFGSLNSPITMNLSFLNPGLYFVKTKNKQGVLKIFKIAKN